jgi:hypothetical protein
MQPGPNQNPPPRSEGNPSLDKRAFESLVALSEDRFSRAILHYGVKAVGHAAIAHRALEHLEQSPEAPARIIETFKLRGPPLSFSLTGLETIGLLVPTAALTAANIFWPRFFPTPDRVGFAHPDFINPLTAHPGGPQRAPVPIAFFQLDWSAGDIHDRAKMGAVLIVAERIWESCISSFRKGAPRGEPVIGAMEQLLNYYSGYLAGLKHGEGRVESLAAGETFLRSLVRRDTEIAARVMEQAQTEALSNDSATLEGSLPPVPGKKRTRAKPTPQPQVPAINPADKLEGEQLRLLKVLGELITDSDPEKRTEAAAAFRRWQTELTPLVRKEHARIAQLLASVEHGLKQIDIGQETFETGDTAGGIQIVREIAAKTEIVLIRAEARKLLKSFGRALTALHRPEKPTDEWPKEGLQRRLSDVILAAYNHGSDAEVVCQDGLKRYGRLCFGGVAPQSLKLLDFQHEITWTIDLTTIQNIRFFYDNDLDGRAKKPD